MKPGAFNATILIRTLAQATGEVDGEESWRVFTPKRSFYSEEGFPGYCSWSYFLVAEGTTDPASPSEESSVSSPLSEEGSEELKDMLDSRGHSVSVLRKLCPSSK
ncbi:hypothetical protein NQZ68_024307 [Dissostichus eleginoides]|nr:hypothetical protein NQZ68_024307 [Dissostichus eleginoides]